tara:strand:+ start:109 stop:372 length:264 start_codon:yes stop_codon:yes gene_type:complete
VDKKYKVIIRTHHMTELLESVDWDEEKLGFLLEEIENLLCDASDLSEDVYDKIERKFGTLAKKALQGIVNTELCQINLNTKGDESVN